MKRNPLADPLAEPTRRPVGYTPLHCADCREFVAWCSPPAPTADVICAECTKPEPEFASAEAYAASLEGRR